MFKKLIFWLYLKFYSILIRISIALFNTEIELLKADPNITKEKDKKIQRKRHRNELLEKFYVGIRDSKYIKEYYELLKKSDDVMLKSSQERFVVLSDKHLFFKDRNSKDDGMNIKDEHGRRYAHFGFFDEKHKHSGKTMGEVLELELVERKTNDDDYEILYIFNNTPIELGLSQSANFLDKKINDDYELKKSWKNRKFPLTIYRETEQDVINKIEEITEFLHVKKINFNERQLEFFIPLKFKINEVDNNSNIFNELVNIKSVYIKNKYGELIGFTINSFIKRIEYNQTHEVWKFHGIEMETIKKI